MRRTDGKSGRLRPPTIKYRNGAGSAEDFSSFFFSLAGRTNERNFDFFFPLRKRSAETPDPMGRGVPAAARRKNNNFVYAMTRLLWTAGCDYNNTR